MAVMTPGMRQAGAWHCVCMTVTSMGRSTTCHVPFTHLLGAATLATPCRFCPECWTFWSIPALISTAVNMYMYQMMLISVAQGAAPPLGALYACSAAGSFCGAGAMAAFAATRRRRLREQEGLPEGRCRDFARYFCCPACAVCQEAAQLEVRLSGAAACFLLQVFCCPGNSVYSRPAFCGCSAAPGS